MAQSNSSDTIIEVCLKFPCKIYSPGLFGLLIDKRADSIWEYSGTTLHLQLSVIFALTQSFNFVFRRLGLPMLIAEIATGIILGQTILGNEKLLGKRKIAFSEDSIQVIGTISAFGYMFFLFLSAVKMDLSMIRKVGNKALWIGFLSVLLPLLSGFIVDVTLVSPKVEDMYAKKNRHLFLAILYSGSSFPVIHCLLSDLKIINSELGRLSLSAAMISDISSLILMNISYLLQVSHDLENKSLLPLNLGLSMIFIFMVVFVFRPTMNWMVRHTPDGVPLRDIFLYAIIVLFLLSPKLSSWFHVFILIGPMVLGLVVPDGPPIGSALVEKFERFVNGILLPLFVTTCAMRVDFFQLDFSNSSSRTQFVASLVILVTKFGVSLSLPFYSDVPKRDSVALAFIMNAKGVVELASFSILSDNQYISENLFAFLTIVIIIMAVASPILVKLVYDPSRKYAGYRKRNIMQCRLNHELRLLACVHLPSNVTSIINVLNSSCPTSDSPLNVNVLHLIKLIGRATPVFISHEKNKKIISNKSYSENVIVAFNQFERDNWGAVEVNVFTVISPPDLMHDDICNLALNELTSFIILPFHRRLSIDGSIESEDQAIRSLNCNILKTAPCSVGILVEGRRYLRRYGSKDSSTSLSVYSIAMIFLGGNDDREALTLAKRFSQDTRVGLTVIHLKAPNNLGTMLSDDDIMLDDEILEDIKDNEYVTYIEEEVRDGPETSMFLRSMVNEHHLIIVGRQYKVENPQTDGLKEWSEFQELGMIGDLLASKDFIGAYSLLVVQQQQQNFY